MNLYIRTTDGAVYSADVAAHHFVVEMFGLDPMDVVDTGFETAERIAGDGIRCRPGVAWRGETK